MRRGGAEGKIAYGEKGERSGKNVGKGVETFSLSLSLPLFFVRFVSTEMLGKRKCGSGDNAVLRHL